MDDRDLEDILSNIAVPEVDENAKKRALNLASSTFLEELQKNEKKSQGSSILARLMNIANIKTYGRRSSMDKKQSKHILYGGMATAMVAFVALGLTTFSPTGTLNQTDVGSSATFSDVASSISTPSLRSDTDKGSTIQADKLMPESDGKMVTAYKERIEGTNRQRVELAVRANKNASLPTIVDGEASALSMPSPTKPAGRAKVKQYAGKKQDLSAGSNRYAGGSAQSYEDVAEMEVADVVVSRQAPALKAEDKRHIGVLPPPVDTQPDYYQDEGRDQFQAFKENTIKVVEAEPVSTFSVDVDTSSYSFIRRQINYGSLPAADAVRVEELVNYFDYNYQLPEDKTKPFKASVNITESPWDEGKKLMHIGIKGYDIDIAKEKPRTNLVFLLDVSGSMNSPDKLPLVKNSMKLLLETLNDNDTVAIAVYAGAAGTVLEPTKVKNKQQIMKAIHNLSAGGSTAGAQGINLAYDLAEQNFDDDAVNRVILATDGDFNVGVSSPEALKKLVESKRDKGIFLSVLGFGQGNFNDHIMQSLAQNGNGVAAYIDSLSEAQKVLVEEASSTLFTIAKDVKLQVEFNPQHIAEYRLVGYETRHLNREDFNNDKVDAGDIGAGHTVTAIYEITPVGSDARMIDESRYGSDPVAKTKMDSNFSDEYAFLKIRYKLPTESRSKLITQPITKKMERGFDKEAQWATAVASYAQLLKGGYFTGDMTYDDVIAMASAAKGEDKFGYRAEFINMVRLTKTIAE